MKIRAAAFLHSVGAFFLSAALWIVGLFAAGASCIVIGSFLLFGGGVAFIVGGFALILISLILRRGVANE